MNPRSLLYMEWLVGLVTDWGGCLVGWLQVSNGTAWMATGRLISGLDKSSAYWFCYWLSIACHWLLERQTGFMQALSKGRRRRTLCSRLSGTRREIWDLARIQPGRRACNTRRGNVKQGQRERKDSHVGFLSVRQVLCRDCGLCSSGSEEGRRQECVGGGDGGTCCVEDGPASTLLTTSYVYRAQFFCSFLPSEVFRFNLKKLLDMHQNRSISLCPTPFDHFHFHSFPALIWWIPLRSRHIEEDLATCCQAANAFETHGSLY